MTAPGGDRTARTRAAPVALLVCLGAATLSASSQTGTRAWTVTTGDVRVLCPLTVGGSFEAKTSALKGMLSLDPSSTVLSGELAIELKTLDTGISLRNEHMRNNYLEVQKGAGFDTATLSSIDVGPLSQGVTDGARMFSARLRLHGMTQPVAGRATLTRRGSSVRVEASFPVRLADYGIADPRYLGVGVGKEVTVRATFTANPAP
jgi:polyisoprenoid-binding protein YceI